MPIDVGTLISLGGRGFRFTVSAYAIASTPLSR
jgi:hypothetical protein